MKIVIAPDSFKESATALQAAEALARGVLAADPGAEVVPVPLADGGEGFTDAMAAALDADMRQVQIVDALGHPTHAHFALAGKVAVVEAAQAVGLGRIAPEDRSIFDSDTRGLGQLVRAALDAGACEIIVGIGGTATNDAGAGMLAELGVRFLDGGGAELGTTPRELAQVVSVDVSGVDPRLARTRVRAACDVNNPLVGDSGASAVYGPQKGAAPDDVPVLDEILRRVADAVGHLDGPAQTPGAGAAGGLGYALGAFCGADLVPGIDVVLEAVDFRSVIAGADAVFTGEGAIDAQTLMGKTLSGVARETWATGVPLVAFAGRVAADAAVLHDHGFTALVPIGSGPESLADALANAEIHLERAAEMVIRLMGGRRSTP